MLRFLFSVILFVNVIDGIAQNNTGLTRKVEVLYNQAKANAQAGDRAKAIAQLNQVIKTDPQYYMAYFGLADIFHGTGERELEKQALIDGLKVGSDRFPNGYKFLAELLYTDTAYVAAFENMEHFSRLKNPLTADETQLLESCRFAMNAVQAPVPFHPENAGANINTTEDEYWPSLNGEANSLVFTRLITKTKTGENFPIRRRISTFQKKDSAGWQKAAPLGPPINTNENEGAQCISADGRFLFLRVWSP